MDGIKSYDCMALDSPVSGCITCLVSRTHVYLISTTYAYGLRWGSWTEGFVSETG
jgi:hypothetical protein